MADPGDLERDATSFAQSAIDSDTRGDHNTAIFYYTEAAQALLNASLAGSSRPGLLDKVTEYINRAEVLKKAARPKAAVSAVSKNNHQLELERAEFLVRAAMEEDLKGNSGDALDIYMEAADLCLRLKKDITDKEMQRKLATLASQALDRAEDLKGKSESLQPPGGSSSHRSVSPKGSPRASPKVSRHAAAPQPGAHGPKVAGSAGYSEEEIAVLRRTSIINGREYVPFLSVDLKERFAFPIPFSDPKGLLVLAPKQKEKLKDWLRPEEYIEEPKVIYAVSAFSIRQTVVSDCSFVASLAISAQYERKFKRKLITSIIYPQNRGGEPVYNPCGKYMIKLHLNGVARKVIIDDRLPMGRSGELLCSYSSNTSELWVSLLEKAYMKVMGGYDFPGSNSSIDLNALTGWIPERVSIKGKHVEFDKDREFERIRDRFAKGHCLVTVATGALDDSTADRAGLVASHAYAMLDIRLVKGQRLLLLKNPWCHVRWKGNWSEKDLRHWTPEMQRTLGYDPSSAQAYDNGIFWIDLDSLCNFFDVFYLSWSPEIFQFTTCIHSTWRAGEGPKKDSYNIGNNPQYALDIKATGPTAVWILLSRHITEKEDFANNQEFITVLVYKPGGRRVYYPYDPSPYKDGVRINSPHYLCKMVEPAGRNRYTLVISQYEKSNTIHYTLRVYSMAEFSLTPIKDPYVPRYDKTVTGQWKGASAGGCGNYQESFNKNPVYQISLDSGSADLALELRGPKQYSVGVECICVSSAGSATTPDKQTSGDYRRGFCYLELQQVPAGVYNMRLSTFLPGQEGPFILLVRSSQPYRIAQLQ